MLLCGSRLVRETVNIGTLPFSVPKEKAEGGHTLSFGAKLQAGRPFSSAAYKAISPLEGVDGEEMIVDDVFPFLAVPERHEGAALQGLFGDIGILEFGGADHFVPGLSHVGEPAFRLGGLLFAVAAVDLRPFKYR